MAQHRVPGPKRKWLQRKQNMVRILWLAVQVVIRVLGRNQAWPWRQEVSCVGILLLGTDPWKMQRGAHHHHQNHHQNLHLYQKGKRKKIEQLSPGQKTSRRESKQPSKYQHFFRVRNRSWNSFTDRLTHTNPYLSLNLASSRLTSTGTHTHLHQFLKIITVWEKLHQLWMCKNQLLAPRGEKEVSIVAK